MQQALALFRRRAAVQMVMENTRLSRFRLAAAGAFVILATLSARGEPAINILSQTAEAHMKRDLVSEASNQQLVTDFYDAIFNKHDLSSADHLVAADYIQHKPGVPNGRDAMLQFAGAVFRKFPKTRVSVKRSTAEGDLVYLHSHMQFTEDDPGKAVFDIFRVTDGKITEHWDVVQDVPPAPFQADSMF